jgi:hypothetical protein
MRRKRLLLPLSVTKKKKDKRVVLQQNNEKAPLQPTTTILVQQRCNHAEGIEKFGDQDSDSLRSHRQSTRTARKSVSACWQNDTLFCHLSFDAWTGRHRPSQRLTVATIHGGLTKTSPTLDIHSIPFHPLTWGLFFGNRKSSPRQVEPSS